jgi:hypothetical protein
LRRNAGTRSGSLSYRASTAQWHADRRGRRPKPAKLATNPELRRYVQDRLSGAVRWPEGCAVAGLIARSMGSRGDCFDNAVAESFFATLKKELIHRRSWPDREELRREVFDYIEIFYNATRRHSTLGMLSPVRYEERHSLEQLNNDNNN